MFGDIEQKGAKGRMARTGEQDESSSFSSLSHGHKTPRCLIYPSAFVGVCIK